MNNEALQDQELMREKVLRKVTKFIENNNGELHIEDSPDKLKKTAYIRESFQVLGQLFNVEIGVEHRIITHKASLTFQKELYLKEYNSRSFQGSHIFYDMDDIASKLLLTKTELKVIFNQLKEHVVFSDKEVRSLKTKYLRSVRKKVPSKN